MRQMICAKINSSSAVRIYPLALPGQRMRSSTPSPRIFTLHQRMRGSMWSAMSAQSCQPSATIKRLRPAWCVVTLAAALATACSSPTMSSDASGLSVGDWRGTTSQGMPIAFTVSRDETVTTITLGYSFNGCSGSQTFSNLNIPTAPNVTCIPAPCTGTIASYRAFNYSDGRFGTGPRTTINGLFLPGNRAEGQAGFVDYPGCGTATGVTWSATKR